jgi:hypothetical protein
VKTSGGNAPSASLLGERERESASMLLVPILSLFSVAFNFFAMSKQLFNRKMIFLKNSFRNKSRERVFVCD